MSVSLAIKARFWKSEKNNTYFQTLDGAAAAEC